MLDIFPKVHVMILSHPPAFSLMDLFRLNMTQLVWMFTARSMGHNPYPQAGFSARCRE